VGEISILLNTKQMAARIAQFPLRWKPYEVDGNGKVTVKANAKLAPEGANTRPGYTAACVHLRDATGGCLASKAAVDPA
jgi:hypothetical protein